MKRLRDGDGHPPWANLPVELVQDVFSFLYAQDLASASITCHTWRAAACAMVTHLTLPLNHPLLVSGPAPGWAELVERTYGHQGAQRRAPGGQRWGGATRYHEASTPTQPGSRGGADSLTELLQQAGSTVACRTPSMACAAAADGGVWPTTAVTAQQVVPPASPLAVAPARGTPLPRLRTDFPMVTHITLIHNAMLHRAQVHAAMSTLRALWPTVRGLSVHDSVTWDLPLDYSALGVMTHITSLELLFQGQGGMDEAGQPMYRASMPHLCKLSRLKELCMKWIIGYDVDSFLDFNEVYDLLASLVRHNQLRSLQFGGENINAEGARHLASITTLETLNLVCDARPASPLHLLDLLTMPRLVRLELMHVCPDHAWNAAASPGEHADPLVELARKTAALASSPLRCLALSMSPGCQTLISRALPLLPHLHSLSVRVTTSEEEEALCAAFRAMQAAPPTPQQQQQQPQQHQHQPQQPQQQQPQQQHQQPQQRPAPVVGSPGGLGAGSSSAAGGSASMSLSASSSAAGPTPPLRALRLETAELGTELVTSVASLTALTSLQLPRGLPSGEMAVYDAAAAEAAVAAAGAGAAPPAAASKYLMSHLSSLGRLSFLRRLMIQMDSPAETAPAFVDGNLVSVLVGLPRLESLHLSTWNLLSTDPTPEALGAYPERSLLQDSPSPPSQPGHERLPQGQQHRRQEAQHTQEEPAERELPPLQGQGQQPALQQQAGLRLEEPNFGYGALPHGDHADARGHSDGPMEAEGASGSGSGSAEAATEAALEPAGPAGEADSGLGGSGSGPTGAAAVAATAEGPEATGATEPRAHRTQVPSLPPLPTWAWRNLRSLSLTHWPCVYAKLREVGPPQLGRCYAVRWDDLPQTLEALLLVRCQLMGSRPPARLRHMWLADCTSAEIPLAQALGQMPELETLVLRWPSSPEEQDAQPETLARTRPQLVSAVASLRGLRTLGLGAIRCQDVPALAPLTLLRHLMLEPVQPPRPANDAPASQRDLTLLDYLMALPPGAMAGLRTLWLPNWAMPIKQLLQWQQMLQGAMPLVVLRVTEYDVVWTVPTPVMHVAQVEAPSSLAGGPPAQPPVARVRAQRMLRRRLISGGRAGAAAATRCMRAGAWTARSLSGGTSAAGRCSDGARDGATSDGDRAMRDGDRAMRDGGAQPQMRSRGCDGHLSIAS